MAECSTCHMRATPRWWSWWKQNDRGPLSNYFSLMLESLSLLRVESHHKIFKNFPRGTYRLLPFHVFFSSSPSPSLINGWISLETIYTPASKQICDWTRKDRNGVCALIERLSAINNSCGLVQFLPARINKLISGSEIRCDVCRVSLLAHTWHKCF